MMTCACAVASGSISPGTHEPASVSKVVLEGCAGGGIKGGDREDCGLVGWTAQARWAAFLADGTQQILTTWKDIKRKVNLLVILLHKTVKREFLSKYCEYYFKK